MTKELKRREILFPCQYGWLSLSLALDEKAGFLYKPQQGICQDGGVGVSWGEHCAGEDSPQSSCSFIGNRTGKEQGSLKPARGLCFNRVCARLGSTRGID